ncbi:gamma-glutamyl-gamma-aminobutyrate hydrolase family protein [Solirubrobacter sp. CPCC 204708]|uniref:Gamma-glutamyl-gamma-aminobutyrate hydrolase family protein n=1 Tax=Solirubrobacter deserti TaxID=2282478 RepID=A0ABT4RPK1_9ACTN|nr:gamma-glutamyl-gamma-aminobutyrate hydrolase family protein [Solirubrobacter deserti]MBE2319913.1 gamma-glutamyl-gamma-aminobutyrate hydrolase family protein [Solirubrobacter deserti]MDA0140493.1 gamma-glutamyl-gamma-aminobutyrate hydrolase family protein [Solirubrobacter deserti]
MHPRPPLIGIVTHELLAAPGTALAPAPGRDARTCAPPRLNLRLTYVHAVQEAGGIAVVLPAHGFGDDAHHLLERVDGLLFSGGPDLDPGTYGQAPSPELGPNIDRAADDYELRLHRAARERDLPVLAVCRGMQALNVARGGTLHQHIAHHRQAEAPHEVTHAVTAEAGSLLHRVTRRRRLTVNTFHHQAVDALGGGLEVIAHAPDGLPEAVCDPSARFLLGVQWHAEVLTHRPEHAAVMRALVDAAAARPSLSLVA